MEYFIIGLIFFTAYTLVSLFTTDEEKGWGWFLNVLLCAISMAFIVESAYENHKWHTEIIHRYQKGDYELELTITKEKVDTIYIFK